MVEVSSELARVRPRLEGKRVLMYVGGSRAHHYQDLFRELGMEVVSAGYEFAHRDDYEGRRSCRRSRSTLTAGTSSSSTSRGTRSDTRPRDDAEIEGSRPWAFRWANTRE